MVAWDSNTPVLVDHSTGSTVNNAINFKFVEFNKL
jgi:hypothetical protein